MLFIDDIRAAGNVLFPGYIIGDEHQEAWRKSGKACWEVITNPALPVVDIDNVAEYYYQSQDPFNDWRRDLPNLAPPWSAFWMEHRLRKTFRAVLPAHEKKQRVGMLFFAAPMEMLRHPDGCLKRTGGYLETWLPAEVQQAAWLYIIDIFFDYGAGRNDYYGPHGSLLALVDKDGRTVGNPRVQPFIEKEEDRESLVGRLGTGLLAISFLHCKNVKTTDNEVDKPLAKKWAAKHAGQRPARYKTLVIEPLKEILRKQGESEKPASNAPCASAAAILPTTARAAAYSASTSSSSGFPCASPPARRSSPST